jgi:hypothetical protein
VQRRGIVTHVAHVRIGAVFEQLAYSVRVSSGAVQSCRAAAVAIANQCGNVAQQQPQRLDFAARTRAKEFGNVRSATPIDFSLERSPARKPVIARNGELSLVQLCSRIP